MKCSSLYISSYRHLSADWMKEHFIKFFEHMWEMYAIETNVC